MKINRTTIPFIPHEIKQINKTGPIILLIKIAFVVLFVTSFCNQSNATEQLSQRVSAKPKPFIVDIALDYREIPFLLDNEGHVWMFSRPQLRKDLIRLPNLKNIKKIAPWMALDKDGHVFTWYFDKGTKWLGENDLSAVYTKPGRVEGLDNITMLLFYDDGKSSLDNVVRFLAVRNNRDIFEWFGIYEKKAFNLKRYTSIKKIYTRDRVKDIAVSGYGTLVLFDDGLIIGWGLNEFKQVRKNLKDQLMSFKVPGAIAVYLNNFHAVVVSENGKTLFWGGCSEGNVYYDEQRGILPTDGLIDAVAGPIADIISMNMTFNDNIYTNVLLKRDGSVWRAYAPLPSEKINNRYCNKDRSLKFWQVNGIPVPAIKVKMSGYLILALGVDHTLWIADNGLFAGDNKFRNMIIDLKGE